MFLLDALDRKILFHLDCQARLTFSELARKIRVGNDIVAYRFERLIDQGVIKGSTVIIDPEKIGTSIVKSYLRLSNFQDGRKKLLDQVSRSKEICWIAEVLGSWDLVLSVYAASPKEYETKFRKLVGKQMSSIVDVKVFHLTEQWKDARPFGRKEPRPCIYLGRDRDSIVLDKLESDLLIELGGDARQSYVELAEKLNSTPQIIKYRLAELERKEIVAGYTLNLQLSPIGLTRFKTAVHIRSWDPDTEKQLVAFLRNQLEVTIVIRQIGPWQLEFDAETTSIESFAYLLSKIRERFPTYIETLEHVMYTDGFAFKAPPIRKI